MLKKRGDVTLYQEYMATHSFLILIFVSIVRREFKNENRPSIRKTLPCMQNIT